MEGEEQKFNLRDFLHQKLVGRHGKRLRPGDLKALKDLEGIDPNLAAGLKEYLFPKKRTESKRKVQKK